MRVTWILDPDSFPDYHSELLAAIQAQGHLADTLPTFFSSLEWGDSSSFYELAPVGACVVCHAAFEFTDLVAEDELSTPGSYGNSSATNCSSYFPALAGVLLNDDYKILPFAEFVADLDAILQSHAQDDRVFVRPDSGLKNFTGRLFSRAELETRGLPSSRLTPKSLVVVSSPKSIYREWRFVVADAQIVSGSLYKLEGEICKARDVPANALSFAAEVAAKLSNRTVAGELDLERVWVLDVCEIENGEMRVVELNSFSSSDWYCCDVSAIVATVSRIALQDWRLQNDPPNSTVVDSTS